MWGCLYIVICFVIERLESIVKEGEWEVVIGVLIFESVPNLDLDRVTVGLIF